MDFRPLDIQERAKLFNALRGNVNEGQAILTDPRDTTFIDAAVNDVDEDAETINAIRSVPVHY
jgi:hypothetical protein